MRSGRNRVSSAAVSSGKPAERVNNMGAPSAPAREAAESASGNVSPLAMNTVGAPAGQERATAAEVAYRLLPDRRTAPSPKDGLADVSRSARTAGATIFATALVDDAASSDGAADTAVGVSTAVAANNAAVQVVMSRVHI